MEAIHSLSKLAKTSTPVADSYEKNNQPTDLIKYINNRPENEICNSKSAQMSMYAYTIHIKSQLKSKWSERINYLTAEQLYLVCLRNKFVHEIINRLILIE